MKIWILALFLSTAASASILERFKTDYTNNPKAFERLKKDAYSLKGKAVPTLVKVMKGAEFPDKNRWAATFLVGRIMGKKSGPFISKYLDHPNWILRMASLKTLLSLGSKEYGSEYAKLLKDSALLVRLQALDNIKKLNLSEYAPHVWQMLYDKQNYYQSKSEGNKRAHIIKEVVKTIGDLNFKKAKSALLKMVINKKYEDIFDEMEYSLEKITGKDSPEGPLNKKRYFWKRLALSDLKI